MRPLRNYGRYGPPWWREDPLTFALVVLAGVAFAAFAVVATYALAVR